MFLPRDVRIDGIFLSIPTENLLRLRYLAEFVGSYHSNIPGDLRRTIGEYFYSSISSPSLQRLVERYSVERHWGLVSVKRGFAIVNCTSLGFDVSLWDRLGTPICKKSFSFKPGVLAHVGESFFTSDSSESDIYVIAYSVLKKQLKISILPLESQDDDYYRL